LRKKIIEEFTKKFTGMHKAYPNHKEKNMETKKPKVVIDAYYNGINGWTYSYTYPDMKLQQG